MLFKKYTSNLPIVIFGSLVLLFFLSGCLPFSVKTGQNFVLEKGDRVSILTGEQNSRYLVLLNPHDGVPFPKDTARSYSLNLVMHGEGEHVKTPSGDGRKFSRLNTPNDNLNRVNHYPNNLITGYVILYEKSQSIEINIKTEDGSASEFNGTHRIAKITAILDDVDVPIINEFFKARATEQLSMIKNATGSIKGIPLRDILISCFVTCGLWGHDTATTKEFTEFQNKYMDTSKPITRLYHQARKGRYWDIFKYKDVDAITIAEDLEQALNRAIETPRFKDKNFDFDRDVMGREQE